MGGVEFFHSDRDWAAAVNNQIINSLVMKYAVDYSVGRVVFTSTACALAVEAQKHSFHAALLEDDIVWGHRTNCMVKRSGTVPYYGVVLP